MYLTVSKRIQAEIVGKMGVRSPHLNSEAAKRQRVETGGVAEVRIGPSTACFDGCLLIIKSYYMHQQPAAAGAALARSNDGAEARRKPARVASSASSSSAASAASSSGLSLRPQVGVGMCLDLSRRTMPSVSLLQSRSSCTGRTSQRNSIGAPLRIGGLAARHHDVPGAGAVVQGRR